MVTPTEDGVYVRVTIAGKFRKTTTKARNYRALWSADPRGAAAFTYEDIVAYHKRVDTVLTSRWERIGTRISIGEEDEP